MRRGGFYSSFCEEPVGGVMVKVKTPTACGITSCFTGRSWGVLLSNLAASHTKTQGAALLLNLHVYFSDSFVP